MKITLHEPVETLSGSTESGDLVFYTRNGRTYARSKPFKKRERTDDQITINMYMSLAEKNWARLTEAQRAAWEAYAAEQFAVRNGNKAVEVSAVRTYAHAGMVRQTLGLSLPTDAPTLPPPQQRITSVQQVAGLDEVSLGLVLTHRHASTEGLQVLVRMTPAMKSVAVKPQQGYHRYVCGIGPNSAAALPPSGGTVFFSPTRFPIEEGERYGVEVKIVRTADGMISKPCYCDFRKEI